MHKSISGFLYAYVGMVGVVCTENNIFSEFPVISTINININVHLFISMHLKNFSVVVIMYLSNNIISSP